MRTTKELLEVMLENIDRLESGLCYYAAALARNDIISYSEYEHIIKYLDACLPERKYRGRYLNSLDYSFPYGEKEPRIKWLKEQIDKLK